MDKHTECHDEEVCNLLNEWQPALAKLCGHQHMTIGLSLILSVIASAARKDKEKAKEWEKSIIKSITEFAPLVMLDEENPN